MTGGRKPWKRRSNFFENLKKHRANFILLRECHILDQDATQWQKDWGLGDIFITRLPIKLREKSS